LRERPLGPYGTSLDHLGGPNCLELNTRYSVISMKPHDRLND